MRAFAYSIAVVLVVGACTKAEDSSQKTDVPGMAAKGSGALSKTGPHTEQVKPPFDLKTPPADAVKTASGLVYKKTVVNAAGQAPKRNDTVMINYTGWRQTTGETFFTNKSRGQPMPLNLSTTAAGFTEAMQLLKKGEKAMLWVPPAIGYKGSAAGVTPETLVYEVEVVDINPAPEVPADVAAPPANAEATKSGVKYVVLTPGAGDKARPYDNLTYNVTAWEGNGRMFETTLMKKRPMKNAPYRQPAALEEVLTSMSVGERLRFWTTAEKLAPGGKVQLGMPSGDVCYELELLTIEKGIEPPAVPSDVAKPPADALKTPKGVFYKILKPGKGGPKAKPTDTVKVNYTGWTTDGRMFDSSVMRNEPTEFGLNGGVIAGWTEGIPVMSVGDKARFWIPDTLAYKGSPSRPQGMLVFDIELLEIKAGPAPGDHPPPHGPPHAPPRGPHGPPPPTP